MARPLREVQKHVIARFVAESLDKAVIWTLVRFFLGRSHHHTDLTQLAATLRQYPSSDPDLVFPQPSPVSDGEVQRRVCRSMWGSRVEEIVFPSEVQTPFAGNNVVHVRKIRPGSMHGKPALIIVPGWIIGQLDPLLWYFGRPFLRDAIESFVIEPPYQMCRTPPGCWTGEYTISGDMVRTFESIRQAVSDVRRLIGILREEGASRIGVMGMSMGGWITSLLSVAESDLALAAIVVPPVNLAEIFEISPLVRTIREDILNDGLPVEEVARISSLLSPLSYPLRVPRDRVRLFQSRYDQALAPKGVEDLWRHWGKPALRKYRTGHINIALSPRFLRDFRKDAVQLLRQEGD